MVSVLGSYKPATASPDSLTTLLAITTLVLPRPFSIALATFATLASLTFVRSLIAPRKSPACSLARVSGVIGSEVFSVTRDDSTINQPCRKVSSNLNGRIRDSGDMMALMLSARAANPSATEVPWKNDCAGFAGLSFIALTAALSVSIVRA